MLGRGDRRLSARSKYIAALFRDVLDEIRTQPGRVGLSFMSIAIGIGVLAGLIAVLGGLSEKSRHMIQELGANVVAILHQRTSEDGTEISLQDKHAVLLAANLPNCAVSTLRVHKVTTLGTQQLLSVVATDSALIEIRQWKLQEGRFLDQWDMEHRERNAVVSQSLSRLWNWKVGNVIMLGNAPFRVVGIIAMGGGAIETELGDPGLILGERVVFIPKTASEYWVTDQGSLNPGVDAIFIRVPASMSMTNVVSVSQRLLSQPGYKTSHLSWVTPDSLIREVKKFQNTIGLTVGSIAMFCLILGGITLMSLMVANVRDRVTEIGLRRAIGASQKDIAVLFVFEACIVASCAGITATFVTHLLLTLGRDIFPIPLQLGWRSMFIPVIVAVIVGMVFSYWPAKSAAKITPSEALRNE